LFGSRYLLASVRKGVDFDLITCTGYFHDTKWHAPLMNAGLRPLDFFFLLAFFHAKTLEFSLISMALGLEYEYRPSTEIYLFSRMFV
jgi:hypothetical protein